MLRRLLKRHPGGITALLSTQSSTLGPTMSPVVPSCATSGATTPTLLAIRKYSRLYEPDYLEVGKSQVPTYDVLNIQIKGYDFAVLESYQKFIHNMVEILGLDVEDGWATPPKQLHIQKFKPLSSVVDGDYNLCVYERNIQVVDVPSTTYSIMISMLTTILPEGVNLSVHEHLPEHEEIRYVPDLELKDLKVQLDSMGGPSPSKKK